MNRVIEGREKFLKIVSDYDVCTPELLENLETLGLYRAPASTMTSLHNSFDGGLVDHLVRVARWAISHNELNGKLQPKLKCDPKSVARVSILHGIGRSNLYVPNQSEWHRKNLGKMYEFNESLVSMKPGERAIYYVNRYGGDMRLTETEYQAILNCEKDLTDDMGVKWHSEPLSVLLRQQIEWAIMDEKILDNE
jgi:hypothetical protein